MKYYGTPITPKDTFLKIMKNRNCLVSYAYPQDLQKGLEVCDKVIIDNGAYTIWQKGGKINWDNYYKWLVGFIDKIYFFLIPDEINGSEKKNNMLIDEYYKIGLKKGVPVWHTNESLERLKNLIRKFDYVAIGSSGEHRIIGAKNWHERMREAMTILCDKNGYPLVKIHILRCLNPRIFMLYPFYSGDSSSLGRNHKRDGWQNIVKRIEKYNSPKKYIFKKKYITKSLF